LTEVARFYTDSIIGSTIAVLKGRGVIDSNAEISTADLASIKERALAPFANMQGFPEDWEAAIDISPAAPNLLAAVGLSKVTPELGQWIKDLVSLYQASVFQNGATRRRDLAGTMFLLLLTEHMRNVTGRPHFELTVPLMTSLRGKSASKKEIKWKPYSSPRKSAEVKVARLKKEWPAWQSTMARLEQILEHERIN
jgi:hypothetical protein